MNRYRRVAGFATAACIFVAVVASSAGGQLRAHSWTITSFLAAAPSMSDTIPSRSALPGRSPTDTIPADTGRAGSVPGDTVPGDTLAGGLAADPAADSIIAQLRQLPGFVITEYRGDSAIYRADQGELRLIGSAEVTREGDRLTADTIIYRDRTDMVMAYGSPRVVGQAQELTGNILYYDLARRRATALGARTQISEGSTWYVQGDVTLEDTDRVFASHARFTTCDLEIPHYHFESDRIMVIRDRILVARPARLYFGNVPVLVLPFIVQNLEQGRRSGLLVPRFSVNDIVRTSNRHTREISGLGYYWAINEYMGAQLTGGWRSGAYTSMEGNLDYNWRRQFLNGNIAARSFWEDAGGTQFTLNARSQWRPDERTDLGLSAQYATSSRFIRDVSYDPRAVTQELDSNLRATRRFDWGSVALGATRRQSISDDGVSGTFPSVSINPRTFTFFQAPTPELERWYSNASLQLNATGDRTFSGGRTAGQNPIADYTTTRVQGGVQQFNLGNLNFSAIGNLNQTTLQPITGPALIEGQDTASGQWRGSVSYQQRLIGQTMLSPTLSLRQEFRRSPVSGNEYVGAPIRPDFGASLSTALFGFFPGVGPYEGIRHRLSPSMSYGYSPQVQQTERQLELFGPVGGRAQNIVSLTLNQSFEAKLREPRRPLAADEPVADTFGGDTARARQVAALPSEPQRVTLLSLSTSPIQYDFVLADSTGNGFLTERVSNSISSDFLRGLTVQVEHELFDRRDLNPALPDNTGRLGMFAPRLSSLSTSFELGPGSALFRWLGMGDRPDQPAGQNAFPGDLPSDDPMAVGAGAATNNPIAVGGGPWRSSINYSYSRPQRHFSVNPQRDDRAIQTLSANSSFMLSPGWGVSWSTDYSITDQEFGSHRLSFRRDLHRWQANFNFYQTPYGNSTFEFFVELIDNRDLKFQHREGNLRIDQGRR
ncbi:putative LPS assembly protein LptD [soil metagenome]